MVDKKISGYRLTYEQGGNELTVSRSDIVLGLIFVIAFMIAGSGVLLAAIIKGESWVVYLFGLAFVAASGWLARTLKVYQGFVISRADHTITELSKSLVTAKTSTTHHYKYLAAVVDKREGEDSTTYGIAFLINGISSLKFQMYQSRRQEQFQRICDEINRFLHANQ